jgi:hypothetical protein
MAAPSGTERRRFDQLSFLVNQRRLQTGRRFCFRLQPRPLHKESVGVPKDHGSFDNILELPDITDPDETFRNELPSADRSL